MKDSQRRKAFVTEHAVTRYIERVERVSRGVAIERIHEMMLRVQPFGAKRGESDQLLDPQTGFVLAVRYSIKRTYVVSVLTQSQARVNVELFSHPPTYRKGITNGNAD